MTKQITGENFQQEVLESQIPVLVDFFSESCGPCRRLHPVLDQLAEEVKGQFEVVKINAFDQPDLANRFSISALPTLLVFAQGKVVSRLVGYQPKAGLLTALKDSAVLAAM